MSEDPQLTEQGLATLYHIINDRLHNPHEPVLDLEKEKLSIITEIQRIAMFLEKGPLITFSSSAGGNKLIDIALSEAVTYFKIRFANGNFKHIQAPYTYQTDELAELQEK
jgi:hypothetical protein